VVCSVGYFWIGLMPGKHVSGKPVLFHKLIGFHDDVFPGLEVSPGQLFQNRFIQHQISHDFLELGVFSFEVF
jgi:hypothetical protein